MEIETRFEVRVRGVVIDQNEMLLVSHVGKEDWLVLPGGHLEWGEDSKAGLERELEEELGVRPEVGALLYVHTFTTDMRHVVEFFFAVNNAAEFRQGKESSATHAHELAKMTWVPLGTLHRIRPAIIANDVENGTIGQQITPVFYHVSSRSVS